MTRLSDHTPLHRILNPQQNSAELARQLQMRSEDMDGATLAIRRVVPRPPEHMLVEIELRRSEGPARHLSVLLHRDGSLQRFHFPQDPELEQLPAFSAQLAAEGECRVLSHRLGRRCIFLQHGRDGSVAVWRLLRAKKLAAAVENQVGAGRALRGVISPRVAEVEEVRSKLGAYRMEYCEHRSLFESLSPTLATTHFARVGRSLRALHDSEFRPGQAHTAEAEVGQLDLWEQHFARFFGEGRPGLRALIARLEWLRPRVQIAPELARGVHRDFYDKQILLAPEFDVFLDFDLAAVADPAVDVGNFMAHLRLRALQGRLTPAQADNCAEAFIYAYEAESDNLARRRAWWQAAALARLSMLYSVRPAWAHLTSKLESAAASVLSTVEES